MSPDEPRTGILLYLKEHSRGTPRHSVALHGMIELEEPD